MCKTLFFYHVIIEIRLGAFEINLGFVSPSVICHYGELWLSVTVMQAARRHLHICIYFFPCFLSIFRHFFTQCFCQISQFSSLFFVDFRYFFAWFSPFFVRCHWFFNVSDLFCHFTCQFFYRFFGIFMNFGLLYLQVFDIFLSWFSAINVSRFDRFFPIFLVIFFFVSYFSCQLIFSQFSAFVFNSYLFSPSFLLFFSRFFSIFVRIFWFFRHFLANFPVNWFLAKI